MEYGIGSNSNSTIWTHNTKILTLPILHIIFVDGYCLFTIYTEHLYKETNAKTQAGKLIIKQL